MRTVCEPSASPLYVAGLVHAVKLPASRLQTAAAPDSLTVNEIVAVVLLVRFAGPLVIVVTGGVVSTVNVTALLRPTFPAASLCSACAVQTPSASAGDASTLYEASAFRVAGSV